MSNRIRWIDRTWRFDHLPVDLFPELIGRLAGAPARCAEIARIAGATPGLLTRREGATWSIQENIGHLADLEALTLHRVNEVAAGGVETMSAADMTNAATHAADHNARPIGDVVGAFAEGRGALVARLDGLAPEAFGRAAIHPRLKQRMRLVDLLWFWSEHDDYHIARMRELLGRLGTA